MTAIKQAGVIGPNNILGKPTPTGRTSMPQHTGAGSFPDENDGNDAASVRPNKDTTKELRAKKRQRDSYHVTELFHMTKSELKSKLYEMIIESASVENDGLMQHGAKADYNVEKIKKIGPTHHVYINNLPTDKNGHVPAEHVQKAQAHFGDRAIVHAGYNQTVSTDAGGRFDKPKHNDANTSYGND